VINRGEPLVVDLSAIAEFEKGHIAGSRNVTPSQFDPENKDLAKARELPVALACRTGQASAQASAKLVKAGYSRVHGLEGGLPAWQQGDLPLVRGKA
jgi:rhodanese-related sulfurtransferase